MPTRTPARTALVVEDNVDTGKLLEWVLAREGFTVTVVPDGRKALDLIATANPPQLVILDVMLPHVNGHQVLAAIRGQDGWTEVPVVVLTAKGAAEDIVKALDSGANDYMLKPFKPEELRARVRRLVPP